MQQIILASGSARRSDILARMGVDFEVAESLYDEDLIKTDDAVELVEELALQKALKVIKEKQRTDPCFEAIVIGGDTTVSLDDGWIAKAHSKAEARAMFGKLVGRTHEVVTGVAVVNSLTGESYVGHERGIVTFRSATEEELDHYAANEKNWRGFAGAYALQGGAAPFLVSQTGSLSAIIGLPIALTASLLEEAGMPVDIDAEELELLIKGEKIGIE